MPRRAPFSAGRLRRLAGAAALAALPGCAALGVDPQAEPEVSYVGEACLTSYEERGPRISYPAGVENDVRPLFAGGAPRTVAGMAHADIWDLELEEATKIALANSEILRTVAPRGQVVGTGFNTAALANPDFAPSLFDPAIAQTGVLFGNRGVEAALADFDANFTSSLLFNHDEQIGNTGFFAGGVPGTPGAGGPGLPGTGGGAGGGGGAPVTPFVLGETSTDTAAFQSRLAKTLATGGTVSAFNNVNYLNSDPSFGRFPSSYDATLGLRFTQPLLAGSGVEYTRIAGPRNPGFSAITGVNQGVVIARINEDINLLDFERNVRDLLKSVEDSYWNLYNAYRQYDTRLTARNSALRTWRELEVARQVGAGDLVQLAQAESQYFSQRSLATQALNQIYAAEAELRRVLVLPVNDGRVIRPATEPVTAELVPDWHSSLAEALCHRPELRQQKFRVKSLEFQLTAARSLLLPTLNFISQYQVNGFGDDLIDDSDAPASSAYGALADGDQTGWQLGLEFSVPVGFRQARLQVRNLEYRLTKARKVLAAQELDVSHQLADAFQQVALRHATATSFFNQIGAARERVRLFEVQRDLGVATTDLLLRAQTDLAAAEGSYFSEVVAYNQAIALLHLTKGTLLARDGVVLSEGQWTPKAYQQALRKAWDRSHALPADDFLRTDPAPFAVPEEERPCPVFLPTGPNVAPYVPGPLPPPVPVPEPSVEEDGIEPQPAPAPLPVDEDADPTGEAPADAPDLPETEGFDLDSILRDLELDDSPSDPAPEVRRVRPGPRRSAAAALRRFRRGVQLGDSPAHLAPALRPSPPVAERRRIADTRVIPATGAATPNDQADKDGWTRSPRIEKSAAESPAEPAPQFFVPRPVPSAADRPVTLGEWIGEDG